MAALISPILGVGMVLYFKTIYALLHHPGERTKADVFYVLFSTVMFLLITVWISMQGISGEKMWVSNAHSSDDPHGLYMRGWYMDVATIAIVVLQLMTDGLMVRSTMRLRRVFILVLGLSLLGDMGEPSRNHHTSHSMDRYLW